MPQRRYRARNLDAGRCSECPKERDPASTRWCPVHLVKNREAVRRYRAEQAPSGAQDRRSVSEPRQDMPGRRRAAW